MPEGDVTSATSTIHPLSNFMAHKIFTNAYKIVLAAITTQEEPRLFSGCKISPMERCNAEGNISS